MTPDFGCPPPGLTGNVNALGGIARPREVMPGLEHLAQGGVTDPEVWIGRFCSFFFFFNLFGVSLLLL